MLVTARWRSEEWRSASVHLLRNAASFLLGQLLTDPYLHAARTSDMALGAHFFKGASLMPGPGPQQPQSAIRPSDAARGSLPSAAHPKGASNRMPELVFDESLYFRY